MQIDNVLYTCERISAISAIPIRVYEAGARKHAFHLQEMPTDPIVPYEKELLEKRESVGYFVTPFHQYYGMIRHEKIHVLIGPVGLGSYSKQQRLDYAFALGVGAEEFARLYEQMKAIPSYPLENFLHMLLLINFYYNGEKLSLSDIAPYMQTTDNSPLFLAKTEIIPWKEEPSAVPPVHSAMTYEKHMLSLVRSGDVDELQEFFKKEIHGNVGSLAGEQLRNLKNLLIVTVTLVSRAAIEGGLLEDEAMELSDLYIRRCEELFSPEALSQLQFHMVIDYTNRVNRIKNRAPVSPFLSGVITYIRRNLSRDLETGLLAKYFHISRNQLDLKFKEETGVTPARFVLNERLKKAELLLATTDKPLTEIAAYLGFSSQSHFQTRFKEIYGLTPMEYRKQFTK